MKLTLKFYIFTLICSLFIFSTDLAYSAGYVTTESFITSLKNRIKDVYQVSQDDIQIEWKDDDLGKKISDLQKFYPGKSISIEVKDSIIRDIAGKQGIPVDVLVDDKQNRIIYVRCKVDVLKEAIVAKFNIKRNESITEDNIKYYKVPVNKIQRNIVPSSPANIVGKVAMIDITENTVITSNLLKEKTVVFRGNQVTIRIRNGDLTLTGVGEALQDGYSGQNIAVRVTSLESKKTVMAKVLDVNLVEINLGGSN